MAGGKFPQYTAVLARPSGIADTDSTLQFHFSFQATDAYYHIQYLVKSKGQAQIKTKYAYKKIQETILRRDT